MQAVLFQPADIPYAQWLVGFSRLVGQLDVGYNDAITGITRTGSKARGVSKVTEMTRGNGRRRGKEQRPPDVNLPL